MISKRRKAQLLAVCAVFLSSVFSLGINVFVDKTAYSFNESVRSDAGFV